MRLLTFVDNMIHLKKNMKNFSSRYVLRNKACLSGGTVNYS